LLLASSRDLLGHAADQRLGVSPSRPRIGLSELPVLVLGAGDIGRRVADSLRPLGATVTLVGRTARDDVHGIDELSSLLVSHRVLVIAAPLTNATRGLIGPAELAAMPDDSIVVNVARGAIVDTDALALELIAGRLRAGLDVTDPEPLPKDHPLRAAPGTILTPHIGGGTRDWPVRAARLIADQLVRISTGIPLRYIVR
jgi:phosphoglycerate dehydrogenase-like enzyme